ncbi:MAG: PIG-L family deacetylase [Muribaculaceae bacterium]|nr:PIG-L family deacetylase [Muribaculaceae bacterium]
MNRREMIKTAGMAAVGATVLGVPMTTMAADGAPTQKKKLMVIGAHPDDPETIAGGVMCLFTQAGHEVVCVYLTRGEAGIAGMSHSEAAAVRVKECEAACAVTGARYIFMDQIDGNTEVNLQRYKEMREMIERENPDIVITHWPIDSHRDHAACGMLVLDAWRRLGRKFKLYYAEAMSGDQSQMFHPTTWVNIGPVVEQKHKACYCHVSQHMDDLYSGWHEHMERFRGIECRCKYAEAFALHTTAEEIL